MSAAGLGQRLERLSKVPETAIKAAAQAATAIAADEGGSRTYVIGKRKRRVKLKATVRQRTRTGVSVFGVPTGIWVWENEGARSHQIPKRKPTARKPRPMFGSGYAHPIQRMQITHPGRSGRGTWRRVQQRCAVEVPDVYVNAVREAIR
jgi:hypothetical protein